MIGVAVPAPGYAPAFEPSLVGSIGPLTALQLAGGFVLGGLIIAGIAVAAQRLLGVRVGSVRMLFAGAIGYLTAALLSATLTGALQPLVLLSVLVGIAVLVTMGVLVLGRRWCRRGLGRCVRCADA